MISFTCCFIALVVGYFVYGKFIEKIAGVDPKRVTPAFTKQDGVDFLPLPTWKIFMIQFLNIAGTFFAILPEIPPVPAPAACCEFVVVTIPVKRQSCIYIVSVLFPLASNIPTKPPFL